MTTRFANAPLVELIAELRWGGISDPSGPQSGPFPMAAIGSENFFMRLGGELYQHDYRLAERLVPPGFPAIPFQPIYRFRKDAGNIIFHAGANIFSVNALRPYDSWEAVEPVVKLGVDALLRARDDQDKHLSFSVANLRYINAFGPDLTGERNSWDFITKILGLDIKLPFPLVKDLRPGHHVTPHLQFSIPLSDDRSMALTVADGIVNSEQRLILDITVSNGQPVAGEATAILDAFRGARNVIHHTFVDLTKAIHDRLQPIGGEHA